MEPHPSLAAAAEALDETSQERIAAEVMGDTAPASDMDYSGQRLSKSKSEELQTKMRRMINRGVSSIPLLARSLGVHYTTIKRWMYYMETEMRRQENDRSDVIERQKMMAKLEEALSYVWQQIVREDVPVGQRIAGVNAISNLLSHQAEIMGVKRSVLFMQQNNLFMNAKQYDRAEVSELAATAKVIEGLLAGGELSVEERVGFNRRVSVSDAGGAVDSGDVGEEG